jgi:hypothetical protein
MKQPCRLIAGAVVMAGAVALVWLSPVVLTGITATGLD